MAEAFVTYLQRRLKHGYTVRKMYENKYGVTDPAGVFLSDGGTFLSFLNKEPGGRFKENLIAQLRQLGAIADPPKRTAEVRPLRRVSNKAPKNSVIIAEETLRDSSATPRERALAKNYLALLETHQTVRSLAQKLGRRLKEIEGQIE